MRFFYTSHNRGNTLLELMVAIAIIGIISGIVAVNLSASREDKALANDNEEVIALINEARSRTLSGDANTRYGVHFESGRAVLFSGTTFTDGATGNKEIDFDSSVTLSSISLLGGTDDVVFDQITGETSEYGTLVLQRVSTAAGEKTITIAETGFASSN